MPLNRSILEFARTRGNIYEGLEENDALGIELEYEQLSHDGTWNTNLWVTDSDGSLRNGGIELISIPLTYDVVEQALTDAETLVRESGAVASERCGLHTHMNMRPYSIGQVWSLGSLYALIEPTLYLTYALGREDSMFAVPLWLNTGQVHALHRDMNSIRSSSPGALPPCQATNTSKYSACNFASLQTFGTIEMRQPYCSTDFEAIRSWVQFCQRLTTIGTSYEDPEEVLRYYETAGLEALQERLFGVTVEIDPNVQEMAEDAAYMISGVTEPEWNELTWDEPILEAV